MNRKEKEELRRYRAKLPKPKGYNQKDVKWSYDISVDEAVWTVDKEGWAIIDFEATEKKIGKKLNLKVELQNTKEKITIICTSEDLNIKTIRKRKRTAKKDKPTTGEILINQMAKAGIEAAKAGQALRESVKPKEGDANEQESVSPANI